MNKINGRSGKAFLKLSFDYFSELGLQPATSGTAAQSPPPETCRVPGLTLGYSHPLLPRARPLS